MFVSFFQVEINRAILKNVGKRSSFDGRQTGLERERFEPFQQHADLNAILNQLAEAAAAQSNDRSFYNVQSPDYFFDDSNTIDAKQLLPSRFHSYRTLASRLSHDADGQVDAFDNTDDNGWHLEKQQSLQQKQHALNGQKTNYPHQWNQQQINDKTDPAQQQLHQQQHQQVQQQPQQKQPLKSFDNNGDFMQSFDLN